MFETLYSIWVIQETIDCELISFGEFCTYILVSICFLDASLRADIAPSPDSRCYFQSTGSVLVTRSVNRPEREHRTGFLAFPAAA